MFRLRDEHIDFISADIRKRGIYLDDLHNNLLDHVCCIIEDEMLEEQDFQTFYSDVIQRFFQKELSEIEDETFLLVTFKNYHTMKKITTTSGIVAAALMSAGILFKFMHWPGASILLVLGITLTSLVFMPLLFIFRSKTSATTRDKLLLGSGVSLGIVLSMYILFKVMHWPGANMLNTIINVSLLIFIPVYFFTGYRNEQTRSNTVLMTVLMILGLGLLFTIKRSPKAERKLDAAESRMYLQTDRLLQAQRLRVSQKRDSTSTGAVRDKIINNCEIIKKSIEKDTQDSEFGPLIATNAAIDYINSDAGLETQLEELKSNIARYNAELKSDAAKLFTEENLDDVLRLQSGVHLLSTLNVIEMQTIQGD